MVNKERCINCEFAEECPYAYHYCFCEDCKYYCKCGLDFDYCKKGYVIECNNGFEEKEY